MRNAPKSDQPAEWLPLKGRPFYHDELIPTSVLGNISEYETSNGHRYRRVENEQGAANWFSLGKTNQRISRATRAKVKVCCKKFQLAFGSFVDRDRYGAVSLFPKGRGLATRRSSQIDFCPWCGKKIQFVGESEETGRPQVRTAFAGG